MRVDDLRVRRTPCGKADGVLSRSALAPVDNLGREEKGDHPGDHKLLTCADAPADLQVIIPQYVTCIHCGIPRGLRSPQQRG